MSKYKKGLLINALIVAVSALLIYLETQLPFFKKFIPVRENKLIIIIFNINMLLILLFLFLLSRAIIKSYVEKKRGIWGSRLKTKLIATFLFVSLIPSFTLFILATGFFNMSMDKWFSQKIEDTVFYALEISQFYQNEMYQRYDKTGVLIAREINRRKLLEKKRELGAYIKKSVATYLLGYAAIYDLNGAIITESEDIKPQIRAKLSEKARLFIRGAPMRSIIPLADGELFVTGTQIMDERGDPIAILLAGDRLGLRGTERIEGIAATYKEYAESRPLKKVLKYGFIVPLSLITIMTIFFSVWLGTKIATEISIPIQKVKEGASIIAKGKFDINLEDQGEGRDQYPRGRVQHHGQRTEDHEG